MSGAYDPGELQRRICVCFSATELRQFIESLGLAAVVSVDKSMQEMARLLVRHFEREAALDGLVARLRQARPLMEWPEPSASPFSGAAAAPPPAPPPLPAGPLGTVEPIGTRPAAPAMAPAAASSSSAWAPPNADTRILADPYASPGAPVAPTWPGTVASPQAATVGAGRRFDPKIWLIVAGLAIAVAAGAFAIGRASSPPEPSAGAKGQPSAAAASSAAIKTDGAAAIKTDGAAAIARGAIDRSLANVARACEIAIEGKPDVGIFQRMAERCGPRPPPRTDRTAPAAGAATTALPEPSQAGEPPKSTDPAEADPKAPPTPVAAPKALPAAPNAGCLSGCESQHRACKQGCGSEPKQSSQYAEYQACLGKCLAGNSKCKLRCN